jgi:hypothetical protein
VVPSGAARGRGMQPYPLHTRAINAETSELKKNALLGKGEYWLKEVQVQIVEPTNDTEFEIQAWLWTELRALGFNIRGEVAARFSAPGPRKQQCRFDLVHFENGKAIGIIEVKPSRTKHKKPGGWMDTRQGTRYSLYALPVRIVYGMRDALHFVEYASRGGGLWAADAQR